MNGEIIGEFPQGTVLQPGIVESETFTEGSPHVDQLTLRPEQQEDKVHEAFNKLPYPVAVFNNLGDFQFGNMAYDELNREDPSDAGIVLSALRTPYEVEPGLNISTLDAMRARRPDLADNLKVHSRTSGRCFELETSLMDEESGKANILVLIRDVTDQENSAENLRAENTAKQELIEKLQAENEALQNRIIQQQETSRIRFHDHKGYIMVIQGNARRLLNALAEPEPDLTKAATSLEDILYCSERNRLSIDEMSRESRSTEQKRKILSIREVLAKVQEDYKQLMDLGHIEVHYQMPNFNLLVEANPLDLESLLKNIQKNAFDAMENLEGPREFTVTHLIEQANLLVIASDTGPGIPAENWDRIFDEGYTTKGTGFGLFKARKIAEEHGGSLRLVRSVTEDIIRENPALGPRGSIFVVSLPLYTQGTIDLLDLD